MLKQMYLTARYSPQAGTTSMTKMFDPQYGDMWDKFVFKSGDIMTKLLKSPEAAAAEKAAMSAE